MRMIRFNIVNDVARGYVLYDKKPPKPFKPMFSLDVQIPVNTDDPDGAVLPEEGVVIKLDGSDIRETVRNYINKSKNKSFGPQMMR